MIKSFRDWKVRNKLLAVFGIIMLMLLVVSGYIFVSTKSMITQIRKIEMGEFERVSLSTEMRAIVLKLEALFLSASSENYSRVFREVESKK
ncbi:MAG: hypothetical protein KKD05_05625, partial [Candidatus Omnitrophica bacterium]|nr:hypothetical protein [Candidatus Omnitrophota bacterium]